MEGTVGHGVMTGSWICQKLAASSFCPGQKVLTVKSPLPGHSLQAKLCKAPFYSMPVLYGRRNLDLQHLMDPNPAVTRVWIVQPLTFFLISRARLISSHIIMWYNTALGRKKSKDRWRVYNIPLTQFWIYRVLLILVGFCIILSTTNSCWPGEGFLPYHPGIDTFSHPGEWRIHTDDLSPRP